MTRRRQPPIFGPEPWDQQAGRPWVSLGPDYLPAGLIKCARCGKRYVGMSAHGRNHRRRTELAELLNEPATSRADRRATQPSGDMALGDVQRVDVAS